MRKLEELDKTELNVLVREMTARVEEVAVLADVEVPFACVVVFSDYVPDIKERMQIALNTNCRDLGMVTEAMSKSLVMICEELVKPISESERRRMNS